MPIYEYQCSNCGHHLEELQSMSEAPLLKCPKCGKDTLQRLIGGGGGLIFKGSGFYLTDYKNKSSDPSKTSSTKSKGESKSSESKDTKTGESKSKESKPADKSDSKPSKTENKKS